MLSNRFSESPVFASLHFYNNITVFNDFFFISAVFVSQTFLVKVTQVNHPMMMMRRMMMKKRMMMKTKAGFLFSKPSQCLEHCRNGGHSIITELVEFISNKIKYIFFFQQKMRRWKLLITLKQTLLLCEEQYISQFSPGTVCRKI